MENGLTLANTVDIARRLEQKGKNLHGLRPCKTACEGEIMTIRWFEDLSSENVPEVGGKNASHWKI